MWDVEDLQADRLIGTMHRTANQVLEASQDKRETERQTTWNRIKADDIALVPPEASDERAGRSRSFLGFGITTKPGFMQIIRVEIAKDQVGHHG